MNLSARGLHSPGILWLAALIAVLYPAVDLVAQGKTRTWPREFYVEKVPISLVSANAAKREWVYRTEHYEVKSQAELTPKQLGEVARVLESVVGVLGAVPYPLISIAKSTRRHEVRLYGSYRDFRSAGFSANAAGVYDPRTGIVSIPIPALLEKQDPGSRLPPLQRYKVLVHELTHQAMHGNIPKLPPWFIEGAAEYFSAMHSVPVGRYEFHNQGIALKNHLIKNLGLRGSSGRARLPSPDLVFNASPRAWFEDNARGGADGYHKYATAALLMHYFFVSGASAPAMDAYLNGIKDVGRVRDVNRLAEHMLLRDTTIKEIELKMVKYWKTQGLHLQFD